MTLDEALTEAVTGSRVRCESMPEGCYVEHLFSHGFVRCWPVERPEDEPNRTQCGFRPGGDEATAEWSVLERVPVPLPAPAQRRIVAGWGKFSAPAHAPEPTVEFCAECDYEKTACVCPKPEANKWGLPKKEPGKWGI